MLTLVLGGARSGKSRFAQSVCAGGKQVAYIATARSEDDEIRTRIARHRQDRPAHWLTVEEPLEVGSALERYAASCDFVLLDCLTFWLSNLCWAHRDEPEEKIQAAASRELARMVAASAASHLVMVSNEVGYGLVPESAVGRLFRDLHGWINQDAARAADFVYNVIAGIPIAIKKPEAGS
jgi:adenosylcobinamide kinase/adenosylcobinamide-phosphate guanylyltransferase